MDPRTPGYPDVFSFIHGITREIWEDRGIAGKLDAYYAADCLVRAPTGLTTDNKGVLAQTLHQFSDRQLVGEEVIWAGYGDGSFLVLHRLVPVMRHQGEDSYGPATGRPVKSRTIADRWVVNGVVTEEWLARDQASFARCLRAQTARPGPADGRPRPAHHQPAARPPLLYGAGLAGFSQAAGG